MAGNYYTEDELFREKHYQVPKVFMTNPLYEDMSNDAKMAWAILRDRHSTSVKNGWIEKGTGRIYFLYSNPTLAEILKCSKPKVISIKKELKKANLLDDRRMGQGKTNRLYLLKPEVSEDDIKKIKHQEDHAAAEEIEEDKKKDEQQKLNILTSQGRVEKLNILTPRSKEFLPLEVKNFNTSNTDLSNTDFSNLDEEEEEEVNPLQNFDEKLITICKQVGLDDESILIFFEHAIEKKYDLSSFTLEDLETAIQKVKLDMKKENQQIFSYEKYLAGKLNIILKTKKGKTSKKTKPSEKPKKRKDKLPEWLQDDHEVPVLEKEEETEKKDQLKKMLAKYKKA